MSEALSCPACDGVGANQHIDESAEARKAKERREAMRKRLDCREENDEKPGAGALGCFTFDHAPMTKDLLPPDEDLADDGVVEVDCEVPDSAKAQAAEIRNTRLAYEIRRDLEETGRSEVLKRAAAVVADRQPKYGDPAENFRRIAAGWREILGVPVSNRQVALMMAWTKIARDIESPQEDNLVDLAGYADCASRVS